MFYKKPILFLLFGLFSLKLMAQVGNDNPKFKWTVSGYTEAYFVKDFNHTQKGERQTFFYNYNRNKQLQFNQSILKFNISSPKIAMNIALHAGTYVQDNYANESKFAKNILEANINVALNNKKTIYLTAGIIPSHIGFESSVAFDNWNLTRSLLAEQSPYYETGIKFTYKPNEKYEFATLFLNGWQKINPLNFKALRSLGTQFKYTPNENVNFNWSLYAGSESRGVFSDFRIFNNFYSQLNLNKRWRMLLGFDLGLQQKYQQANEYNFWCSPIFITQFSFNDKLKAAIRFEHYQDKKNVIVAMPNDAAFVVSGLSFNTDYFINPNLLLRMELRGLYSSSNTFQSGVGSMKNNRFFATSLAYKF
jgi:hypothetical protein